MFKFSFSPESSYILGAPNHTSMGRGGPPLSTLLLCYLQPEETKGRGRNAPSNR